MACGSTIEHIVSQIEPDIAHHDQEKVLSYGFSLGRESKEWNMCVIFWLFGRLSEGLVSFSPDLEH